MKIPRHWLLFRFGCFTLLALAISLLSLPSSLQAERIAISTPSRGLFEFPVVVSMRKGFYKSEGIDVDKIQMQPAIGVKALISGDVDYLLAWGSALRAAVTGVPIKAVVGRCTFSLRGRRSKLRKTSKEK
jgi:ABC-type nitrate/sulfonate/bicarbonate transport system substrate-binding protein